MSNRRRWVEAKPGEWWLAQTDASGNPFIDDATHPPEMFVLRYGKDDDTCLQLEKFYNGMMPSQEENDYIFSDDIHICGKDGLDDLIEVLTELKTALYGKESNAAE